MHDPAERPAVECWSAKPRMWPPPIKLEALLELAWSRAEPRGWLYLPEDRRAWNADTSAYMLQPEDDQDYERTGAEAGTRGYRCTVDDQTLEDIVQAVHMYLKADSFQARLEALIYYQRFDAFLPSIGAPDPPPWEEAQREADRKFYDSLGVERGDVPCRAPGCARGAVALSVLCKVYHFEQVHGRACPFAD
jgi:hypothetical protein